MSLIQSPYRELMNPQDIASPKERPGMVMTSQVGGDGRGSSDWQDLFQVFGSRGVFTPQQFGALANGSADDSDALEELYATACAYAIATGTGAAVYWPTGYYTNTRRLLINQYRVHTYGAGEYATSLMFHPASAQACFLLQMTNPALAIAQCTIRGFGFIGGGSFQKVAIDVHDASDVSVEDIVIGSSWVGNSGSSSTPSIGIRTYGREFFRTKRCTIFADRPVHVVKNPNAASLSGDLFHFQDMYLAPQVALESSYLFDNDATCGTITFDGYQSVVGGKYGIRGLAGASVSSTLVMAVRGLRFEQAADLTGYAIDWRLPTQNLLVDSCNMGGIVAPSSGGLLVTQTQRTTLLNSMYTGTGEALNVLGTGAACESLELINTFLQDGSTVTLTGMEQVFSLPSLNTSAPIPPNCSYVATAGTERKYPLINGAYVGRWTGSLASGGNTVLSMFTAPAPKAAIVTMAAYSATGPVQEGGAWLATASATTLISGTANCDIGNTANKFCLFFEGVNSVRVVNNLAQTCFITVEVHWVQ